MLIYIVVYIFILLLALYYGQRNSNEKERRFLIVSFTILALLSGLRSETVGKDTISYLTVFEYLKINTIAEAQNQFQAMDMGYMVFVKIITLFTHSEQVFLLIQSTIICGCIGRFVYRRCDNVYLSTIVFYSLMFTSTMNIMRQYLALSLMLLSMDYISEKKVFRLLLMVLIAISFHRSAIVFIIILIVFTFRSNKSVVTLSFVGMFSGCILLNTSYLDAILPVLGYSRLVNRVYLSDSDGLMAYIYLFICIIGWIILYLKKQSQTERCLTNKSLKLMNDYRFNLVMTTIAAVINYMVRYNELFARLGGYFLVFFIPSFPEIISGVCEKIRLKKYRKIFMSIVYIALMLACYVSATGYVYSFLVD